MKLDGKNEHRSFCINSFLHHNLQSLAIFSIFYLFLLPRRFQSDDRKYECRSRYLPGTSSHFGKTNLIIHFKAQSSDWNQQDLFLCLDDTQPSLISQHKPETVSGAPPVIGKFTFSPTKEGIECALVCESLKIIQFTKRAQYRCSLTMTLINVPHFMLKVNNWLDTIPPVNPLLAAIDLREALPRVVQDYKKIHCDTNRNKTQLPVNIRYD